MTKRAVSLILVAVLLATACGGPGSTLELHIDPIEETARLNGISRLQVRVYAVGDVEVTEATATNAAGQSVTGASCEAVLQLAPDAQDCVESPSTAVRDLDLVDARSVPSSGRLTIDRPDARVQVYVELPGDDLRVDNFGRLCRWNGRLLVEAETAIARIPVEPSC
ncbi:MAG: hypothetical protein AAF567_16695 [Actinomycetota bacterium]